MFTSTPNVRPLMAATAFLIATLGSALAAPQVQVKLDNGKEATSFVATSLSVNFSQQVQYDPQTGAEITPRKTLPVAGPFYFTRASDSQSPLIIDGIMSSRTFPSLEITLKADASSTATSTWQLSGVVLNNYNAYTDAESGKLIESFDVNYTSGTFTSGLNGTSVTLPGSYKAN